LQYGHPGVPTIPLTAGNGGIGANNAGARFTINFSTIPANLPIFIPVNATGIIGGGNGTSGGVTVLPPVGSAVFPGGSSFLGGNGLPTIAVDPTNPNLIYFGPANGGGVFVPSATIPLTNSIIPGNTSMAAPAPMTDPWPQLTMLITGDPVAAQQFQNRATQLFGPMSGGYTVSTVIPLFNGSQNAMNTFYNDVVSETQIAKVGPTIISTPAQSNQDNNP